MINSSPWVGEPNEEFWDYTGGIRCSVKRVPDMGHLCGYISVPPGHPWHGLDDEQINADVHGGITHVATQGDRWEIGFDCAHSGDLVPELRRNAWRDDVYRDFGYVTAQVIHLAEQALRAAETP